MDFHHLPSKIIIDLKEFLEGRLFIHTLGLYNVNEKLFHLIGALFDDDNNICAMYETVEGM
ncbi:MAG: hypothetical protein CM15mP12_7300 [Gammaproteobacteria bacterium]|nr:MAG: hypothetical protein CM15mP12_7300 [Gammaproteobacteria bacterium]